MLEVNLKETAKMWLKAYKQELLTTSTPYEVVPVEIVLGALREKFGPINNKFHKGLELDRAVQKKEESVLEFYLRLTNLARKTGMTMQGSVFEDFMKRRFLSGVKDSIRNGIQLMVDKPIEVVLRKAQLLEKTPKKSFLSPSFSLPVISDEEELTVVLQNEVKELKQQISQLTAAMEKLATSQQAQQQSKTGGSSYWSPCTFCGKKGHKSEACWTQFPD